MCAFTANPLTRETFISLSLFLCRLQKPTKTTVFWHTCGSSFSFRNLRSHHLLLFSLNHRHHHTLSLSLSLLFGLSSVFCYFSSIWRMTCSCMLLFTISTGSFPQIVARRFLAKGSEKWALTVGADCSADCLLFVLFAFKVQFWGPDDQLNLAFEEGKSILSEF